MNVEDDNCVLQKCGVITTTLDVGKRAFYFNCIFCDSIFSELESFMLHIEVEHIPAVNKIDTLLESNIKEERSIEKPVENLSNIDPCEVANEAKEEHEQDSVDDVDAYADETEIELQLLSNEKITFLKMDDIGESNDDDGAVEMESLCTETESDNEHKNSLVTMYDNATMMAIFSSYERHDLLWNVDDPMFKNEKLREKAYCSIASDVGKSTEWRDIRELVKRLRFRLGKELQKKKLANLNDETFIPIWEQDMQTFLKQRKKLQPYKSKKLKLPVSKLTDAQCLELIETYKNCTCLWDEQDITYRFKNRRQEALTSALKILEKRTGVSLTQSELEIEIVRIRKICSQEKLQKLNCEDSITIYQPSWKYYDKLAFLEVDVGPFKCSVCAELLDSPTQYKVHTSTHDGSMPFNCIVCKQSFSQLGNMTVHLRRHTRDYEFECDVCKKRFATSTDLVVHIRGHTGEKPYICDMCGQSFRAWGFFDTHMRRHQNVRDHKCKMCPKMFYSRAMLLDHMGTHCTVRDKICNVCGKGFTTKKHLRQHKQIHLSKKKYICKICGKQFAQCAGLSGHMKTHCIANISKLSD